MTKDPEEWRPIPGYEGLYKFSSRDRLWDEFFSAIVDEIPACVDGFWLYRSSDGQKFFSTKTLRSMCGFDQDGAEKEER